MARARKTTRCHRPDTLVKRPPPPEPPPRFNADLLWDDFFSTQPGSAKALDLIDRLKRHYDARNIRK